MKEQLEILLIDDNPDDGILLSEMISDINNNEKNIYNFNCVQVFSCHEAADKIKNNKFDILLLDLSLPDNSGLDCLEKMKSVVGLFPVIILTGLNDAEFAIQSIKAGAQDYLIKGSFADEFLYKSIIYAIERFKTGLQLQQAEREIRYRANFESLISRISTEFISLNVFELDKSINKALMNIGNFTGADRAYVFLFQKDGSFADNTHEWCRQGIPSLQTDSQDVNILSVFPLLFERVKQLENFHYSIETITSNSDKQGFKLRGIQSVAIIPMHIGEEIIGFCGFESIELTNQWTENVISLFRIAGEIFSNALKRKYAFEQIIDKNDRLNSALEASREGLWDFNFEKEEYFFSPRFFTMLKYRPGEFLPSLEKWYEFIIPDEREEIKKIITYYLEKRKDSFEVEFRARRKDGDIIWVLAQGKIFKWKTDGSPARLIGTTLDISHRKAVENELKKSEERLSMAIEGSELGLWDWNMSSGEIFYNDKWCEALGYCRDELIPIYDTWIDLLLPADRAKTLETLNAHIEGKTFVFEAEFRMKTKQGSYKWILSRGRITEYDKNGIPLRMAGTQLDITKRKESEEEILRLTGAINQSGNLIFITDLDGNIVYANRAFEKSTGYSLIDIEKKRIGILDLQFEPEKVYYDISYAIAKRNEWSAEIKVKRKNNDSFWAYLFVTPVSGSEGQITSYLIILTDITKEKNLQEERENLIEQLKKANAELKRYQSGGNDSQENS